MHIRHNVASSHTDQNYSGQENQQAASLSAINKLLDEKLGPLQTYIATLDTKIVECREICQAEMWDLRCLLGDEIGSVSQDLNAELQKLKFGYQQLENEVMKQQQLLGDMNVDGMSKNALIVKSEIR